MVCVGESSVSAGTTQFSRFAGSHVYLYVYPFLYQFTLIWCVRDSGTIPHWSHANWTIYTTAFKVKVEFRNGVAIFGGVILDSVYVWKQKPTHSIYESQTFEFKNRAYLVI